MLLSRTESVTFLVKTMKTSSLLRFRPTLLRAAVAAVALPLALCSACSDDSEAPPTPAGDAAAEASSDASNDAATEEAAVIQETGPDVQDAGQDVSPDSEDAASDTGDQDQGAQDAASDAQDAAPAQLGVVTVPDLVIELQSKDFLLNNVHVPYAGEIPKTDANITYLDVPAIEAFIGSKLDTKVVVYCMSNYMSGIAGNALVKDGYSNVRYLDGGLGAWQAGGNPVEYHDQ